MKFNSQICTTREQSERLLALGLKRETADMHHSYYTRVSFNGIKSHFWKEETGYSENAIPAWSMNRLMCMLPRCVENGYHLVMSYDHIAYRTTYDDVTTWWRGGGNVYDMIIETIEWLIQKGIFNKEYLQEQADNRREE